MDDYSTLLKKDYPAGLVNSKASMWAVTSVHVVAMLALGAIFRDHLGALVLGFMILGSIYGTVVDMIRERYIGALVLRIEALEKAAKK